MAKRFLKQPRSNKDPYPPYWSLRRMPPGAQFAVPGSEGKSMVWYLPYSETPYDITAMSTSATVEVFFGSIEEGESFFHKAIRSGYVEKAELRIDAKGHPRGRLVEEYDADKDTPPSGRR